ncbi:MAG TPA: 2,3-bisphosphoglycerate-independent phosphoglycerate mutase [Desulfobacteraceae bacterium]|nr:2,3-bisphosphoglycerate-independent phosphoglycerate mutase [Deltaproteobacteria bacterium]HDI60553.1 2,3-bisphosphoglycerate-independent phosphoglycerate mutase [Desulfobacteraceae bacterium]
MSNRPRPVMLIILDGWGINPSTAGNAVAAARTPVLDALQETYPTTQLITCGPDVGLPEGIMGNSEVGHLNIGAGRIVYQDLLRIDRAIADGSFFANPVLNRVMDAAVESGGRLHLMGLVSDGGVHSQLTHLLALLDMARAKKGLDTFVHAITDGRDTAPDSGLGYLEHVQAHIARHSYGRVASVCGRYWAMDRDKRWDRTARAWALYTRGEGHPASDPLAAVREAYARQETDEFIAPVAILAPDGRMPGKIVDGDAVIFFNFRADRARQLTRAFTENGFEDFDRGTVPQLSGFATMTRYDETFSTIPVAFGPVHLEQILGEVVSTRGLRQLRIAETEKYAHVTYFFNGGDEKPFAGEDRCLVPSPRDVPTYDLKPEMSAAAVTEEVLARIDSGVYDLIVLNFANMDMVGHTGVMAAAVAACETVDRCVGRIMERLARVGGGAVVTADHGNAEQMLDEKGHPHTAHTLNPVRLILMDPRRRTARLRPSGRLADIAPTLLEMMGITRPSEMTGASLIEPD